MPSSPKRYGFIMDDDNWPLREPPELTHSVTSSNESIDKLMPVTPKLGADERESFLLPGFHFSTTDENVDPAAFHRIAAQLLSGETDKLDDPDIPLQEPGKRMQENHLHCNLGRDPAGRHCCSCGRSYSSPFKLGEHIQQCAGTSTFPCKACDEVFVSTEKLDRHVASRHNNDEEACPECGELYLSKDLPKHLASGSGGCDGMLQLCIAPEVDDAYKSVPGQTSSQQYWIYDGNHDWTQCQQARNPHDSGYVASDTEQVEQQTMDFVTRLLKRPGAELEEKPCDLCGEIFNGDALAQHIGQHSLAFTEKRHRCDECRIYFANERDLTRHLQSANLNQHCGFTFRHRKNCTGHHPATYYKSSLANDHSLMQRHLWSWELSQLRANRAAIATVLAQTLSQMSATHMSLQDCKRAYASMLPHFSIAKKESFRSSVQSSWLEDHGVEDLANLDGHFSRILDEAYPEEVLASLRDDECDRPDSTILAVARAEQIRRVSKRRSLIDLAKRKQVQDEVKKGHKRYAMSASGFALLMKQQLRDEHRPQSVPVA